MTRTCLAVTMLLLFVACATTNSLDSTDKSADLKVGDVFDLSLESNPSTGFAWFVVEGVDGVVSQVGEPTYLPSDDDGAVVGAGGTTTFEFEAVGEGSTVLILHYKRSWEDVEPELVHEVEVTVTP